MEIFLNNLTFHNCPVELREKAAFSGEQRHSMLRQMHAEERISEAVILETCNRLEFYLYAKKSFDCKKFLKKLIRQTKPDAVETWSKYSRQIIGIDVARHLFEVASGLDSQMLGENQILSQVKSAYTESLDSRMSKFLFHHLFHSAFRAAKAVRTKSSVVGRLSSGVCRPSYSIGLAAVELAKREIDLSAASAMVIGAGENAELVAKYLVKAEVAGLIIANRDKTKAQAVCNRLSSGKAIGLEELAGRLAEVDLVISSTAAQEPIITYQTASKILSQRKKPLLIIDIAVPRDVDAKIGELECVRLYDIDDLGEQILEDEEKRKGEIDKARQIISEFTDEFAGWYNSLNLVPVISQLTRRGLELARSEAQRYAKDFGDENSEKLQRFAESLIKKILHGPINFLKNGGSRQPSAEQLQAADLINKMFLSQNEPAIRRRAEWTQSTMSVLTVATRGGALAIAQTQVILGKLKEIYPEIRIKIKKITTKGDRDKKTSLWQLKTSGFFTSQVEDALLAGEADLAIHSFKDLPTQQRKELSIAAVCDRQFAEDCVLSTEAVGSIEQLKTSAKVGTSSVRRMVQLKRLRPDLKPMSVRGNVTTRIRLLEEGKFDAIILARAGVERLGLAEKISFCFDPKEFIPAPAQGALAVQTRADDTATSKLITAIDDKKARAVTFAERQILVTMRCGCHAPAGAFAEIEQGNIKICAFISDCEGRNFVRREITGPAEQAEKSAEKLAKKILKAGGREILEKLEK